MKSFRFVLASAITLLAMSTIALADNGVPVVEAYQATAPAGQTQTLSMQQRVQQLEQRLQNLDHGNLLTQIDSLQQEVQTLRGQLEVQGHDLKLLNEQQRSFYRDLDQRISKLNISGNNQAQDAAVDANIPSPDANANPQEKQSYLDAYELLKDRKYDQAAAAMQTFIKQFPDGPHAINANYWLGELSLLHGNIDKAIEQFNIVVTKYPGQSKVPDAMLKLGFAYYDKGDMAKAKEELTKVQEQYPNTSTARLAQARLKDMQVGQH